MTDVQDYEVLRSSAGVYARGRAFVHISGPDTDVLLRYLLAKSTEYAQPGTVVGSLALDDSGHPIDYVLAIIGDFEAILVSDDASRLLAHIPELAAVMGMADVTITPLDGWAGVAVEGPAAWKVVDGYIDDDISAIALDDWVTATIPGVLDDGRLVRTGTTGEYGYLIFGQASQTDLVNTVAAQAAETVGGGLVGQSALLRACIEMSHPVFPDVFADGVSLREAGAMWAAGAGREDDYRGKSGIGDQPRTRGLVAVEVINGDIPPKGSVVLAGIEEIGHIHLVTPRAGQDNGLGLALLDTPFHVPGLTLSAGDIDLHTISRPTADLRSWIEPIG